MVLAAFGAVRTKDNYLEAPYKRLAARRGALRVLVAVEHSIITAIWHVLLTCCYLRVRIRMALRSRSIPRSTRPLAGL
ncbi:hypothetical protein GCM10009753_17620 [Streptantibioticus ferralitis]